MSNNCNSYDSKRIIRNLKIIYNSAWDHKKTVLKSICPATRQSESARMP